MKELVVPVRSTSKPFEECVVLVLGSAENIMDDYGEPVVVGGGGGEEEQEDQEHGGVAGDSGTTTVTLDLSPQIGAYDGHRPRIHHQQRKPSQVVKLNWEKALRRHCRGMNMPITWIGKRFTWKCYVLSITRLLEPGLSMWIP